MIVHECNQGDEAWHRLHLGIPTASRFDALITATGKPAAGDGMRTYLHGKLAEIFLGQPVDSASTAFMERGKGLEALSRSEYEWMHDAEIAQVGFVTLDDGSAGCSPDGLVGSEGMVEFKNYGVVHHVAAALAADRHHWAQVQGGLWICERAWCDRLYSHPCLPATYLRIERDDDYIGQLAEAVTAFNERLNEAKEALLAKGWRLPIPTIEVLANDMENIDGFRDTCISSDRAVHGMSEGTGL